MTEMKIKERYTYIGSSSEKAHQIEIIAKQQYTHQTTSFNQAELHNENILGPQQLASVPSSTRRPFDIAVSDGLLCRSAQATSQLSQHGAFPEVRGEVKEYRQGYVVKMDLSKYVIYMVFLIGNYLVLSKGQKKPTIAMDPSLDGVIEGESVYIICTLDSGCTDAWVYLYRNSERNYLSASRTTGEQCSITLEIQVSVTEYYTCVYSLSESGKLGRLQRSDPLIVTVLGLLACMCEFLFWHLFVLPSRPKTPTITLNSRFTLIVKGERVKFICAVSSKYSCSWLYLHRKGTTIGYEPVHNDANYHFATFEIATSASEYYTCTCETLVSGSWRKSEHSDRIDITVIEQPRKPLMSLNPSEQRFLKGEFVTVICGVDFQSSTYRFRVYNSGREMSHSAEEQRNFTSFQVQAKLPGNYTCVCGINNLGEWTYSVHSEKIFLNVMDRPKRAEIRLNDAPNVFLKGEEVSLTCKAGDHHSASQFYLYQGSDDHSVDQRNNIRNNVVSFRLVAYVSERYWCAYQTKIAGRLIHSENSTTVYVPVIDRPANPEISLNQNFTTVIRGEICLLTCKALLQDSDNTFYLYKVNNSFQVTPSIIVKGKHSVTFNLTEVINLGVEHYRCKYNTIVLGRSIDSELSDPVILTVVDRPLKPICLLETQGPVTENEQNVTVNCTAPNAYPIMKFYFYVNSQNQLHIPQVTEGHNSATIITSVPRLKIKTEYFTCRYQVKIAGRWVESDTSNPQRLVGSDGLYMQLILGLGSALTFLLIILLTCKLANIKRASHDVVLASDVTSNETKRGKSNGGAGRKTELSCPSYMIMLNGGAVSFGMKDKATDFSIIIITIETQRERYKALIKPLIKHGVQFCVRHFRNDLKALALKTFRGMITGLSSFS
ncbi:uncharacterized protein [Heterodontus francisci]|uniref:uncharacterized protein n=1 Tax=Heterodontus francisci TaxID=7792 RepID=UPI00355BF302